jgi:hypothetical protein
VFFFIKNREKVDTFADTNTRNLFEHVGLTTHVSTWHYERSLGGHPFGKVFFFRETLGTKKDQKFVFL